ncbi:MAG: LCP family protein [Clostridiales bacterium]|nr:LCP family protein [Clostridiales bacterium]
MRRKKSSAATFFRIVFGIIAGFSIAVGLLLAVAYFTADVAPNTGGFSPGAKSSDKKTILQEIVDSVTPLKERTNFLIVGVDSQEAGVPRTDTIIAGCFNAVSLTLNLISVPRDTYVVMTEENQALLKDKGKYVPASGEMKACEVYHYAGNELGMEVLCQQIESLLAQDFEYYVTVDFEALRFIVDSINGVEFDVPQAMRYDDPLQGLHINLEPGPQVLNGDQAEQLLRYRHGNFGAADETPGYPLQDLGRAATQHAFIKAMASQALSSENIINSLPALLATYFNYVETNFSLAEAPKYLKYVKNLRPENIVTATLPCSPQDIGGKSYVVLDEEETLRLVNSIF